MRPRVWAPAAWSVALVLGEHRQPMAHDEGGWWEADADLTHRTDYAFSVDGGPPRPDPRSAWQPSGVHGASRVFDAGRFGWTDQDWRGRDVRGSVLYELHVGTYSDAGTLDGAAEHLPELVELGVDVVELMPVAPFPGEHGWGYDGVGLYAVHEPYGGPAALQRFVDHAHGLGLAVCLDVVHNHLGPSGAYVGDFGPYWTDAHHTPWGAAINLDQPGSEEVRRWIVDSALRWFRDFHVDALRLDAVHALVDESPRHLLAQLSDEVAALSSELGRPLGLIAESDLNDVVSVTPTSEGGWGMTAQWADDVHHAVHALVTGERHGYYADFGTPEVLAKALTGVFVHDGEWSSFRQLPWGRPVPAGTDGHRFVVSASTHDQVGNRALGDRPSAKLPADALAVEAALILLSPFTPMLFMGEEWGARTPWQFFTDYPEPELAEAVREGRRREFGGHGWAEVYGSASVDVPDPQDPATFLRSKLDRSELEDPASDRLRRWYRDLIQLRKEVPELASGDLGAVRVRWGTDPAAGGSAWSGWVVVERGHGRVLINLSEDDQVVGDATPAGARVLASWGAGIRSADDGITLSAHSVTVVLEG